MMGGARIGRRAALQAALMVLGGSLAAMYSVPTRAQTPEPTPAPTPIPTPTPQPVYTAYTDPLNRFSFALAEGWMPLRATVPEIIGAWAAPNDTTALLSVIRFPLPPGTTGDAFAGAYLALLRDQPGYRALDARVVSVAEQDAPLLDYLLVEDEAHTTRVQQVFLVGQTDGTVVAFRCPAEAATRYAAVVGVMIGSFAL